MGRFMNDALAKRTALKKREWRKKNQDKIRKSYNNYVIKNRKIILEKQRERYDEMVEITKELENCTRCFKPKENPSSKLCLKCKNYNREYYEKHKHRQGGKTK